MSDQGSPLQFAAASELPIEIDGEHALLDHTAVDSDYSSDSSINSITIQPPNDIHRSYCRQNASSERTDIPKLPESSFPVLYKFFEDTSFLVNNGENESVTTLPNFEKIDLQHLKDLVKFSPTDILSRAWNLISIPQRNCQFPFFSILSTCPNVLETRFTDVNEISKFMCDMALEISKRYCSTTPVYLRSLILKSTVNEKTFKLMQDSASLLPTDEAALAPLWEADSDETFLSGMDASSCDDNPSSIDFCVALASSIFDKKLPFQTLQLLHQLMNKCLSTSQRGSLNTWGVQYVARLLVKQLNEATHSTTRDVVWISSALSLAYKIAVASSKIDLLLSLFRWTYLNLDISDTTSIPGLAPLLTAIDSLHIDRVKLLLPSSACREQQISFAHTIPSAVAGTIKGICVVGTEPHLYCVFIMTSGVFKASLRPPFQVIAQNTSFIADCCRGVFSEGNKIFVLSNSRSPVVVLNEDSLEIFTTIKSGLPKENKEFDVYFGNEKFVSPYYLCENPWRHQLFFTGAKFSGTMEPSSLLLPKTTDSLSVQFLIYPTLLTSSVTTMQIIAASVKDKNWLSVKVSINYQLASLHLCFEHGKEVIAEIEEPVVSEWSSWSATLTSVNDVATWIIYKNGMRCDARIKSGPLVRPLAPIAINILSGWFCGYIAAVQLWSGTQTIEDMRLAAMDESMTNRLNFLVCSFRLNEGVGCCLHSKNTGMIFWAKSCNWSVCPKPLPVKIREEEKLYWRPRGEYYVITNGFEIAVIEEDYATWIDQFGRIIQQQSISLSPSERYFYCTTNGRFYITMQESIGVKVVSTPGIPTFLLKHLPSLQNYQKRSIDIFDSVIESGVCSATEVALYLAHKVSNSLVTFQENSFFSENFFSFNETTSISLRTLGRLLVVCQEITVRIAEHNTGDFEKLLLCICGRLLTFQVRLMQRCCPSKIVLQIVDTYSFLQSSRIPQHPLLNEATDVFSELHKVAFSECVSRDYQLKLITESKHFRDVKQLLQTDTLPTLVYSVIEKGMNKPFVTFLNRLKQECQVEANSIFTSTPVDFDASETMLATLLGVFSQKESSQWHLVGSALINSLCRYIIRCFEQHFPVWEDQLANMQLLKQTSIGTVLFPVVHYLYEMDIDPLIVVDYIEALKGILNYLQRYALAMPETPATTTKLTEAHSFVPQPYLSTAFTTKLDLQYARNVRVEVSALKPRNENELYPHVLIIFLDNELRRYSKTLSCDETKEVVFERGGKLSIQCKIDDHGPGITINVYAAVELPVERGNWIKDICQALICTVISASQQTLLKTLPSLRSEASARMAIPASSFLRGGLSSKLLKNEKVLLTDKGETPEVHAHLCKLAEGGGAETNLGASWRGAFIAKQFPYANRIENVIRWASCALTWHSLKNAVEDAALEQHLSKSLDVLKKKSFLFLEVLQQGKEKEIVKRAQFILHDISPRARIEAHLTESQQTEEPVVSANLSSFSQKVFGGTSYRSGNAEALQLSTTRSAFSSNTSTRRTCRSMATVNVFRKSLRNQPELLFEQIIRFLIQGAEQSTEEIANVLCARAQCAATQIAAHKLNEELCRMDMGDTEMFSRLLISYLQYRDHLCQQAKEGNPKEIISTEKCFGDHYAAHMSGCGLELELELRKAVCSFVQTAFHHLRKKLSGQSDFLFKESLAMCSILCHPWDGVDLSILQPSDIFDFLYRLLSTAFMRRLRSLCAPLRAISYIENRGLFDLRHRCLVVPNSLCPISIEGVYIADGEVQGLHVENTNVVCTARNHWKALIPPLSLRSKLRESDCFANYGLPCIVSKLPDVEYFEITLDLSTCENSRLSIGVSCSPLAPTDMAHHDATVKFSSDGVVTLHNYSTIKFSDAWGLDDVIGCGVFAPNNSIFFTRNGEFLGVAIQSDFTTLVPFVEVYGVGALMKVIINFGMEQPFKFNIAHLHCSCRYRYLTATTVCDTALLTLHYLITMCYKNFSSEEENALLNRNAISNLLEKATAFLYMYIMELLSLVNNYNLESNRQEEKDMRESAQEIIVIMISRLFHCLSLVTECFRFDAVTPKTHVQVLKICAFTLSNSHEKWIKVRAAQCLSCMRQVMREDFFAESVDGFRPSISIHETVRQLFDLARSKDAKDVEAPYPNPKWVGNITTVCGKGTFYGSTPMPAKGIHMVGFRIIRRQQMGQGSGAPLGGCYYVGLCHGQPLIPSMNNLISRSDVYVLQDTDDQDQVPHLLLKRQFIPRNSRRRIYGNDEIVWVQLNADLGEITYYRDNMVFIGLAFANIEKTDDLYPIVYHFNDDASCEIVPAPAATDTSVEYLSGKLRRSVAIHTLQQLHLLAPFSAVIMEELHRSIAQLDRSFENCLVALAVLGGERSYLYCQHDTFGLVVVYAIADITGKAIVYLVNDEERQLFVVFPQALKPSFIQTPLYATGKIEAVSCASLLTNELYRSLYEASVVAPFVRIEKEARLRIEDEERKSLEDVTTLDLIGILSRSCLAVSDECHRSGDVFIATQSSSFSLTTQNPVAIMRQHSTKSLFTPNPSLGATTTQESSTLRGCAIFENNFTIAIVIAQCPPDSLMYVGLTTSTDTFPERVEEVANWEDTWALCSFDSEKTNNVNCCVEPGMIFSGDNTLYNCQDILILSVKRNEGTLAFSRLRKRKHRVNFGVLFEEIPVDAVVRPIVVCGSDTVIVFSFMDGVTFPARNTFSMSNFANPFREWPPCTVCETLPTTPWYATEDNVSLCEQCFVSWQYPKELFFLAKSPSTVPATPQYLVSNRVPETFLVDNYVEFEENCVLSWSNMNSVNVEMYGASCISILNEGFAITEPLSMYGTARVDVQLGYIAGVSGYPFSGLLSFTPMWREDQHVKTTCNHQSDSLSISSSLIPLNTKALFSIRITEAKPKSPISLSNTFIGITNLAESSYMMSRMDLERLCASNKIWGTWCDSKQKVSYNGTIFILVDGIHKHLFISSSLGDLYHNPFLIVCNTLTKDDNNLRLAFFSHDACHITSFEGLTSYSDTIETSFSPIAVGLVPETLTFPNESMFKDCIMLSDTIHRTMLFSSIAWTFSQNALSNSVGVLFHINDILTFIRRGSDLRVFCQGVLIASLQLNAQQTSTRYRLMLYLSASGLSATFVPPLFGCTHLGRVVKVHGHEVAIVESVSAKWEKEYFTVRRKDVRFCALALSTQSAESIQVNTKIAFKLGASQPPKRGTVLACSGNNINLSEIGEERTILTFKIDQCFSLENEGNEATRQILYPLVVPPMSILNKTFEVGKSKFGQKCHASYNGIVFDGRTIADIELTGISVSSHTSGRNRVDVFFRKGSHKNHERDARGWTPIFSGHSFMNAEELFFIPFTIFVDAGCTFSLYINTSHNCGVGFYGEEDGCKGEVGDELDSDGVITIFLGRKSGSSTAFGDFSLTPRGFCGTIMYKQNKSSKPPLIEDTKPFNSGVCEISPMIDNDFFKLISRPLSSTMKSSTRFMLQVKTTVRIERLSVPVALKTASDTPRGLIHCIISTFYCLWEKDTNAEMPTPSGGWNWVWNSRVSVDSTATEVVLEGASISLSPGKYLFALVVRERVGKHVGDEECQPLLVCPTDETYTKSSQLLLMSGFSGDIIGRVNSPSISGERHTMTTGMFLNQSNSASYNGIMFDLCSKQDIILEEIFCISQTNSEHVTVRLFWKEGSMERAEKSPPQWWEVSTKEMQLVDKEFFSVGPLFLRLKANQRYAVFINTTSSCGVRFYNSSDGHVGEIGDVFENDGILSVYVGRKSESSSAFTEISMEPRAFRGKITYRTYTTNSTELVDQAIFFYPCAFITTRILVALSSYVDSAITLGSDIEYEKLLPTVVALASSPIKSIDNLDEAENVLMTTLKESPVEQFKNGVVTLPLSEDKKHLFNTINKDDLMLLVNFEDPARSSLVVVHSVEKTGESALVCNCGETESYHVSTKHLIPLTKCYECKKSYAAVERCTFTNTAHRPPLDEESRTISMLANAVSREYGEDVLKALVIARNSLQKLSTDLDCHKYLENESSMPPGPFLSVQLKEPGQILFQIPFNILVPEEISEERSSFICPFIFCTLIDAYVSLSIQSNSDCFSFDFLTDLPVRKTLLDGSKCYYVQIGFVLPDNTIHPLVERAVVYIATANGRLSEHIVLSHSSTLCSCISSNGRVSIVLSLEEGPFPFITKPLLTLDISWTWEDGTIEAQLNPLTVTFLKEPFGNKSWPPHKRHFCLFSVLPKKADKTIFLEIHVVETRKMARPSDTTNSKTRARKPFSLTGGEVLTLGFSMEGDFFVIDENDAIRCYIDLNAIKKRGKNSILYIGFVCVHFEKVTALLFAMESFPKSSKALCSPEIPSSNKTDVYDPIWRSFDPLRVKLSKNDSVACCCSEVGGQTVLGSILPNHGVSAFVIQIDRHDRPFGSSLGSGHFAGVSVTVFPSSAPLYSDLKHMSGVWVVQDVQDGDSLPNQETIPPLEKERTTELFYAGTKLLFIVDRHTGTLSLARDNESPRIVFHDLPRDQALCPFVRLDHTTSCATLSRFSPGALHNTHRQTSLEKAALSQPITPTFLRHFPLQVVVKLFPVMLHVVNSIPVHYAAELEKCWNDVGIHTKFQYRMSNAIETMVEDGAFSHEMMNPDSTNVVEYIQSGSMQNVVDSLTVIPAEEVVGFSLSHEDGRANNAETVVVYFRLPPNYEVIGTVGDGSMIRIIYIGASTSPIERTLCLIRLDSDESMLHTCNDILPHPSTVQQHAILQPLNSVPACGVIINGWFDCTLASLQGSLGVKEGKKVAAAIVCGLEHWHLHGIPHGHVDPHNILLRITNGIVMRCALWKGYYLHKSSIYASQRLQSEGVRGMQDDLWSCEKVFDHNLQAALREDVGVRKCSQMLKKGEMSISEIIRQSEAFQSVSEEGGEGPNYTLRTGARLRGGSGSYNGIMFDVVAKSTTIRIIKLTFFPDTNSSATVTLFTRDGTFLGYENDPSAWKKILEVEMVLSDNTEIVLEGFEPITVSAGARAGLFLHTTSGSGVIFYSETEGVAGGLGQVEEENSSIGITVGKKSESNQPFNAIQNQKRLLKGSINYTLITRSNGPRSSLIYTYDPHDEANKPQLKPMMEPVYVQNRGYGLKFFTLKSENKTLVMLRGGVYEWVDSNHICLRDYTEAAPYLVALEIYISQMRLEYYQRVFLSDSTCRLSWGSVRPLLFEQPRKRNGMDAQYVANPLVSHNTIWFSERLEKSCVVSLSPPFNYQSLTLHFIQDSSNLMPSSNPPSMMVSQSPDALKSSDSVFFHVDVELGCVFDSFHQVVCCASLPCAQVAFRIVISWALTEGILATRTTSSGKVSAYVNFLQREGSKRLMSNFTVLCRSDAQDSTVNIGGVVVKCNKITPGNATKLFFMTLIAMPYRAHVFELGKDKDCGEITACSITKSTSEDAALVLPDADAPALLIDLDSTGPWTIPKHVILAPQSPSLEVNAHTVTQILCNQSSKCVASFPHFTTNEVHHVVLRVVCPTYALVCLSLELSSGSQTAPPVILPYAFFDCISNLIHTEARKSEFIIHLHVDLYSKKVYIASSTGTFVNALCDKSSYSRLQLTFTLSSPGSLVEVLSWRHSKPRTELCMTASNLTAAVQSLGISSLSSNVAHTVGTITRHSLRKGTSSARENTFSASKQMEVLIVTYARLLLGKALLSQDAAREAVQAQLHFLLSFTTLHLSPEIAGIIENEIRHESFNLIAQSCAYLLAPSALQTIGGVDTSINVLSLAMRNNLMRQALKTELGPTLLLLFLRTATIFTRSTRHSALQCAQELVADPEVPLPPHDLLTRHLDPILGMMRGLCKREKMASAVVQIGVTLIADLIQRYRLERPSLCSPGICNNIPFQIVVCARAVVTAITNKPPKPLPEAFVKERQSTHRVLYNVVTKQHSLQGMTPCYCTFSEEGRDVEDTKMFEVTLMGPRKGAVIVGWDMDYSPNNPMQALRRVPSLETEHEPLPSCGYFIEPCVGEVFVCLGRMKEAKPLKMKARPGDVIVVSCSYKEQLITLWLRRGLHNEVATRFRPSTDEHIAIPFVYLQHKSDATLHLETLSFDSNNLSVAQLYADLQANPHPQTSLSPQSHEFYAELNLFSKNTLENMRSSKASLEHVSTHEISGYPHLSLFLAVNAFAETVSIQPLMPYLKQLHLFDALTSAFSPLINLQRRSELFDIFCVLKNLCSKETEEKIQADVMRPFQNRVGRKVHVTVNLMQARPSASLGPYPTLMRSVFGQLYLQLQRSFIDTFFVSPIFTVKLVGFGSTDAGGPYRDVLSQLASEIMTTHPSDEFQLNPLFIQFGREEAKAVMPNPNLMNSTQTPLMLEFFGKLLASFFITPDLLAVEFPPLFWKLLLNEAVSVEDLKVLDSGIGRLITPEELMKQSGEELEERFPGIGSAWKSIVSENSRLLLSDSLPPSTLEAAELLSRKIVENELNRFAEAMNYIQRGFSEVLPLYTLQVFRWQKVELLICGAKKLSFEAFRGECDIQLPENESIMFLKVLKAMSDEDRRLLLRFTTGQFRLPLKSRIKVQHNGTKNSLPTSSTCFFTLRLPTYTSQKKMRERLLYAIRQCNAIDADGQAREGLLDL